MNHGAPTALHHALDQIGQDLLQLSALQLVEPDLCHPS
jgi:hypothetical protein